MTHTHRPFARYASLTVTLLIALTTVARSEPPQDEFRRLVQSDNSVSDNGVANDRATHLHD